MEAFTRPGLAVSDLVDQGFAAQPKLGVAANGALSFFRGLGLDRLDRDLICDGRNWWIEDDMVIATHIYLPGGASERVFLKEIVSVSRRGNQRFFDWDGELLTH